MAKKSNKKTMWILIVVIAVILVGGGITFAVMSNSNKKEDDSFTIDDLANQGKRWQEEAIADTIRLKSEINKLEHGYFFSALEEMGYDGTELDELTYRLEGDGFVITYRSFDGTIKTVRNQ